MILHDILFIQYNHKEQNETAVREEMVELANLLDGVRFQVVLHNSNITFVPLPPHAL